MKSLTLLTASLILAGCASTNDYQTYIDHTSRVQQSINASEAACFLVLAEAMKNADTIAKTAISTQIDKCKKEPPKIESPGKNWLGF